MSTSVRTGVLFTLLFGAVVALFLGVWKPVPRDTGLRPHFARDSTPNKPAPAREPALESTETRQPVHRTARNRFGLVERRLPRAVPRLTGSWRQRPAKGAVLVRVVDSRSGQPLVSDVRVWIARERRYAALTADGKRFRFDLPPGWTRFYTEAPLYKRTTTALHTDESTTECVVELEPEIGVLLEFVDGDGAVELALDEAHKLKVRPVSVLAFDNYSISTLGSKYLLGVPQPGTYRVDLPRLPGYMHARHLVVEVGADSLAELTIELQEDPTSNAAVVRRHSTETTRAADYWLGHDYLPSGPSLRRLRVW